MGLDELTCWMRGSGVGAPAPGGGLPGLVGAKQREPVAEACRRGSRAGERGSLLSVDVCVQPKPTAGFRFVGLRKLMHDQRVTGKK